MLSGVCGGIGEYFNIDPVLVRLGWVVATFFSAGAGLLGYIIAIAVIPKSGEYDDGRRGNGCLYAIIIAVAVFIAVPVLLTTLGVFSGLAAWAMHMLTGWW